MKWLLRLLDLIRRVPEYDCEVCGAELQTVTQAEHHTIKTGHRVLGIPNRAEFESIQFTPDKGGK